MPEDAPEGQKEKKQADWRAFLFGALVGGLLSWGIAHATAPQLPADSSGTIIGSHTGSCLHNRNRSSCTLWEIQDSDFSVRYRAEAGEADSMQFPAGGKVTLRWLAYARVGGSGLAVMTEQNTAHSIRVD